MESIAEKLSFFLASKNIIEGENKDFYRYSIECLLLYLINLTTVFGIVILMGRFVECLFFVIVFSGLRTYSGGIHMKTWYSCYVASCIIIIGIVNLVYVLSPEDFMVHIGALSTVVVWSLAPCEDKKHKMKKEKREHSKRKARINNSLVYFIASILFIKNMYIGCRLCLAALVLNSLLLLSGWIKMKIRI